MYSGETARAYIRRIINDIDAGRKPTRSKASAWVKALSVSSAVGMAVGLGGCLEPEEELVTRDVVIEAQETGTMDSVCARVDAEPGCDICLELGWYDDGECDEFCDALDGDCAMEMYGVPFETDCGDGVDNDGDELIDCDDTDCSDDALCAPVARYMGPFEADCGDGVDNDGDDLIDCMDSDCMESDLCMDLYGVPFEADCGDGVDNDGDGMTDCDDADCSDASVCPPVARYMGPFEADCGDGVDNDGDELIDCLDSDCAESELCMDLYGVPFE